jgi:hypothetical protein
MDLTAAAGELVVVLRRVEIGSMGTALRAVASYPAPQPERRPDGTSSTTCTAWTGFDSLRDDLGHSYLLDFAHLGISGLTYPADIAPLICLAWMILGVGLLGYFMIRDRSRIAETRRVFTEETPDQREAA